jgi:hypothetical protein
LPGGIEEAKERPVELKSKKHIRFAGLRIADSSLVSEGDYSD